MATAISLRGLSKHFGEVRAVDELDLDIADGEFFSMLGPSGSGKTTVLRMIAGFEQPTAGRVMLAGDDVTGRPPFARDVNTVFQDYALFPHMNVRQNVEYGLRVKKVSRAERRGARDGGAGHGPARGVRRPPAAPALRRAAPAGRPGPGPGQPAQGAAARRAARRARPQAAPRDADRAEGDPARRRHHLRLRHARPGGGAHDERPDRGLQRRAHRAGGDPGRALRAPGERRSSPASSAPPTCWRGTSPRDARGGAGPFCIRPEKDRCCTPADDAGPTPATAASRGGTVREVVYLGSATHSVVDLDAGATPDRRSSRTSTARSTPPSSAAASRSVLVWSRDSHRPPGRHVSPSRWAAQPGSSPRPLRRRHHEAHVR